MKIHVLGIDLVKTRSVFYLARLDSTRQDGFLEFGRIVKRGHLLIVQIGHSMRMPSASN